MRHICILLLTISMVHVAAQPTEDWVARERIRAGWIYPGDGAEQLAFFRQYGMNALIISAANSETFSHWAREAQRADMRLFGVVGASCDGEKLGMRRCVFGNGYESILPCPLDESYWDQVLIARAVELALEGRQPDRNISGILIDWEMYANSSKGGQIYFTDGCYCDHCFAGFLEAREQADVTQLVAFADRVTWLKEHELFDEYHPHLQQQVRRAAVRMREAVAAANQEFHVGFYPVPHNWHLVGVAQGLGTSERPMILWSTTTYGGGGPSRIADNWADEMAAQDIHCYYCGGMLLRMYSAANLAKNIYEIARKSHGYWLFTVHTLCIEEAQQRGDYHLCAGTPEEYLEAVRLANSELDHLAHDGEYSTALEFVPEPVRYRHPGFDIGRFELPDLLDQSSAARGEPIEMPPLDVIATGYLMMQLDGDDQPELVFEPTATASGAVWGVSYAVLDPSKTIIASGRMNPGERFTLSFRAQRAGLHTIVLTPGYYARCRVLTTTVPYAHRTWGSYPPYELAGPGGTIYFHVPVGLDEFTIDARCHWGTAQVQLAVLDPDGQTVIEQATDPLVRHATLRVPTRGMDGQLWALRATQIEGKSYRSLQVLFDPRLPAAFTLRPDFVFTAR